jgi:hypothetical protein
MKEAALGRLLSFGAAFFKCLWHLPIPAPRPVEHYRRQHTSIPMRSACVSRPAALVARFIRYVDESQSGGIGQRYCFFVERASARVLLDESTVD